MRDIVFSNPESGLRVVINLPEPSDKNVPLLISANAGATEQSFELLFPANAPGDLILQYKLGLKRIAADGPLSDLEIDIEERFFDRNNTQIVLKASFNLRPYLLKYLEGES